LRDGSRSRGPAGDAKALAGLDKNSVLFVAHHFRNGGGSDRHHGLARKHGLGQHHAKGFVVRVEHEQVRKGPVSGHVVLGYEPEKTDFILKPRLVDSRFQPRAVRTGALSYRSLQAILKHRLEDAPLPEEPAAAVPLQHANLRGAAYYQNQEDPRPC